MLEELQRRNYSPATTRGYILAVKQFAEYFGKSPDQLGPEEVRRYQLYLLNEKKLAPGTVEIRMSALRFLYRKTLKRRDLTFDDLPFPKTPRKLPTVLSREEVTRLIEAPSNLMHRTILMVLYGTGMRRTEASLLKVSDIDSQRMVIHIRQGKGSRDRDVPLTPKLLEALREYWRWRKPKVYLFSSTSGHRGAERPISDKTVWYACREAAVRAGLNKTIGPHTLRHSAVYAGTGIVDIPAQWLCFRQREISERSRFGWGTAISRRPRLMFGPIRPRNWRRLRRWCHRASGRASSGHRTN
jgi:integrase